MITINVPDMTCGHCRRVVSDAISFVDENAEPTFDIGNKNVSFSSSIDCEEFISSIIKAGYSARKIEG